MAKQLGPQVLTANDLLTGGMVWWAGDSWSPRFEAAVRAGDEGMRAALGAAAVAQEAADVVVGAALITVGADGLPTGLREGRRLAGPSIALPGDALDDALARAA